jgi:hypothetical protein
MGAPEERSIINRSDLLFSAHTTTIIKKMNYHKRILALT